MNAISAELLQQAIQHTGDSFGRNRQLDVENNFRQQQLAEQQKRDAIEQAFRDKQLADSNRRADAEAKRLDLASQPHIQADLVDPDSGSSMTFTGSPEQLDGITAAAAAKGKRITVSNKKAFAAQYNLNGAQFSFSDPDAAKKFADDFKANHGVDVTDPQFSRGANRKPQFAQHLEELQNELDAAQNAETPEEAQLHAEKAGLLKAYLDKQGKFAPPKPVTAMEKTTIIQDKPKLGETTPTFRTNSVTTKPITSAPIAPAATKEKVRVIAPDGTPGFVPASQLEAATKQGYKLAN